MEPEAGPSQLSTTAAAAAAGYATAESNGLRIPNGAFVPVPGLSEDERMPRSSISGTQDLLGAFDLIGLYEQVVRPYVKLPDLRDGATSDIKGKAKAENALGESSIPQQQQPDADPSAASAIPSGGPKKMPRGYMHLVADLPGNYNTQKDNYLKDLSYRPDFQNVYMQTFDEDTLRSAFALEEGITPEVDAFMDIYPTKKKKSKRKRDGAGPPPPVLTGGTPHPGGTPGVVGTPQDAGGDDEGQGQAKKRKTVRLND